MPALSTVNAMYVKRIRDLLRTGIDYRTSQLSLGSGTSAMTIQAQEPGAAGNSITVAFTVPSGTSGIAVTTSGNAVSVALAVSAGTPTAANTATAIAAAINVSASASALIRAFVTDSGAGTYSAAMAATALSGGSQGSGDSTIQTLPMNFLRAQDMASVLEVLQDTLDQSSALTATGGTSTSVQDTGAFVANSQIGNKVVFTGNTTAALAGVTATVVSNTANALFFANGILPATPAAGDTYTIVGALVEPIIMKLRDNRSSGDSSAGNALGDSRLVVDALVRMTRQLGGTISDRSQAWPSMVTGSGSTTTRVVLNMSGIALRPDQFKNMRLTVSGSTRKIAGNDDSAVFFDLPLASAPAASTAVTISKPSDSTDACDNITFAPGGQPADNRLLAELIRLCEAAVVAFTLPT